MSSPTLTAGTGTGMLDPMPPNPAYDLPPLPAIAHHAHTHHAHVHKSAFRRISSKLRLTRSSSSTPNPIPGSGNASGHSHSHSRRPSTASSSVSPSPLTGVSRKPTPIPPADRDAVVSHFLDLLPRDSPIATRPHVEHAFAATGWLTEDAALEYLEDWSDAYMGALHPVDRRIPLLGIENSGNTCFIDSLLFALFARMDAVDAWVTQSLGLPSPDQQPPPADSQHHLQPPPASTASSSSLSASASLSSSSSSGATADTSSPLAAIPPPPPSPPAPAAPARPPSPTTIRRASLLRAVQTHLTLLATRLRKGHLVTRSEIRTLEVVLKQLWAMEGTNSGRLGEQEDVAELFLMLASCLRAPCLPLWQVIHHGAAIEDQDDKRVCTERCLQLAIPDPKVKAPVALEELLEHFFFDNKVTLLRKVQRGDTESDDVRLARKAQVEERWRLGLAPRSASSMSVTQREQRERGGAEDTDQVEEQMVDAWSTFKLMPFLVGENESGEHSGVLLGDNSPILIPICLKRYYQKEGKSTLKRTSRPVLLPIEIGFDQFTAAEAASSSTSSATPPKYSLVLQSVICHLGESPSSGHFITYVNASPPAAAPGGAASLPRPARGIGAQPTASALSTAPSSPSIKPSGLAPAASPTPSLSEGTHRPAPRATSPAPPPPYSPALPPRPGAPSSSSSSSSSGLPAVAEKKPTATGAAGLFLTRSFSADSALFTAHRGRLARDGVVSDDQGCSSDDSGASVVVDDPGPIWLRFDGLGAVGSKVQAYTSTVAITRQLTDEIAKNAYLVFYDLRRVFTPPPLAEEDGQASTGVGEEEGASTEGEDGLQPAQQGGGEGSPVAQAAEADAAAKRSSDAPVGREDEEGRLRLTTAPARGGAPRRPKHARRHSVAGGGGDADLALALKMQAKEAAKQRKAEAGGNCVVM